MATGVALAHFLGIGFGALGGGSSAVAAFLDRRAGRRVRGVIGAVPGFRRRDLPASPTDIDDPIVAAMNLPRFGDRRAGHDAAD